jgi:hypothetical protein
MWTGINHEAMGDEVAAAKNFEVCKKLLGGNNLEVVKAAFYRWNITNTLYPIFEPVLIKYGFK